MGAALNAQRGFLTDNLLVQITNLVRDVVDMFRTGRNRASYAAWLAVLVVFLIGSRTLITDRIPALGGDSSAAGV